MDGDHPASGNKRSFEGDENDISPASKKCCTCTKVCEEGVAAAMIASLTESLQSCKDELASCQRELESAKAETDKWNSAFKKESFVPASKSPEPAFVIDYIQTLRSSDKSLKEKLEIAQMKLAIRDLKSQLKPASMKTDEYPEVDSEHQGSTPAGPSLGEIPKDDEQEEPDIESLKTIIEDQFRMIQTQNSHFQTQSSHIETLNSQIQTQNSQIQTQNSLFQRFDAFFDYLAAKDPQLAALRSTNLNPKNDQAGSGNDQAGKNDANTVDTFSL
ncbi:uncharacterized protein LOC108814815 [Raphanus sativus]|uniref:Uncharacterized protein LOC108814815 n=1 Tax=Raphanus sativus TaxID=3726 RepID=A0A9W3C403_RAPSA|nr:uncharacterized protein LOC108814815 [Raphanus sativus]